MSFHSKLSANSNDMISIFHIMTKSLFYRLGISSIFLLLQYAQGTKQFILSGLMYYLELNKMVQQSCRNMYSCQSFCTHKALVIVFKPNVIGS